MTDFSFLLMTHVNQLDLTKKKKEKKKKKSLPLAVGTFRRHS